MIDFVSFIPSWLIGLIGVVIVLYILVNAYLRFYKKFFTVVPPAQVHIVVTKKGRRIYWSKVEGEDADKATYWFFPWWMTRQMLPLEIIKMEIDNVELHDEDFAPFMADIRCWVVIEDPLRAAERLGDIYHEGEEHARIQQRRDGTEVHRIRESFRQVEGDVKDIIRSIGRYASMNIKLTDLMRNRAEFRKQIYTQIDVDLEEWGLGLKTLEILHIKDHPEFDVIQDYEKMRAQQIETISRVDVAKRKKVADIAESDNARLTRLQIAENEEKATKREIERQRNVDMAQQDANMQIQEKTQEANLKQVEAERAITVGQAEYNADALVKTAEGDKTAAIVKAEGEAQATLKTGTANADVKKLTGEAEAAANQAKLLAEAEGVRASLLAEAEGKDKLAEAQAKFQDTAMAPLAIEAAKDVMIAQATQYAQAIAAAKPTIISSNVMEILGKELDIGNLGRTVGFLAETAKAFGVEIPGVVKENEGSVKPPR